MLCRPGADGRAAVEVKTGRCRAVGRRLSAFVEESPEVVRVLRAGGFPVHSFDAVSEVVRELRALHHRRSRMRSIAWKHFSVTIRQ